MSRPSGPHSGPYFGNSSSTRLTLTPVTRTVFTGEVCPLTTLTARRLTPQRSASSAVRATPMAT